MPASVQIMVCHLFGFIKPLFKQWWIIVSSTPTVNCLSKLSQSFEFISESKILFRIIKLLQRWQTIMHLTKQNMRNMSILLFLFLFYPYPSGIAYDSLCTSEVWAPFNNSCD